MRLYGIVKKVMEALEGGDVGFDYARGFVYAMYLTGEINERERDTLNGIMYSRRKMLEEEHSENNMVHN